MIESVKTWVVANKTKAIVIGVAIVGGIIYFIKKRNEKTRR